MLQWAMNVAANCEPTWKRLSLSIYVGVVKFKGDSSEPKTFLEYLEEDRVIVGVEGAAQV